MTTDERDLLLDTMMKYRDIFQSEYCIEIYEDVAYQNQEMYYWMMDVIVIISLEIKETYRIPCISDYYSEFMTNDGMHDKVARFHETLIKNELLKMKWSFQTEELYFEFVDEVEQEGIITVKEWERVIESELSNLPEIQSEIMSSMLKDLHDIYGESDEEKMYLMDIDYHCAYIILEGPHIPGGVEEEVENKLNKLIYSLTYIHQYTCAISWSFNSEKLQVYLIILGEFSTGNEYFEACGGYYLFPGVLLIIQSIQEIIDCMENK